MELLAVGLNHQSAPLAVRERLAFNTEQLEDTLRSFSDWWTGKKVEAALLSTCNRTELYCAVEQSRDNHNHLVQWLDRERQLPTDKLSSHLYVLPQQQAVRHAFRVASGLDSMVLGEAQILGQMKQAARHAENAGTLGTHLHQLFQRTFAVAKEVRSTTEIGAHSVSMAAAAVRLAQRIFGDLSTRRVLFVGAGEMVELCATHFAAQQPRQLVVANRTVERGRQLAQRFNGEVLALAELPSQLHKFDIVISCTASTLPLIGLGMVESASRQRKREPIFMVDLAVPRDIEPEVARLDDVFLYSVDDLSSIVQEGRENRQAAVEQAEAIIENRVQGFMHWLGERSVVPVIRELHERGQHIGFSELEHAKRRLAKGDAVEQVLEQLTHRMTQKFLHGPMQALHSASAAEREVLLKLLPSLFNPRLPEQASPSQDNRQGDHRE